MKKFPFNINAVENPKPKANPPQALPLREGIEKGQTSGPLRSDPPPPPPPPPPVPTPKQDK